MPSQKARSKEDTWTPDELNRALKTSDRRSHRDEDRKRDRINGEDKHRKRREEVSDRHRNRDDSDRRKRRNDDDEPDGQRLTEDDRERQRRERREKREKDSKPKKGEIQFRGKSEGKSIDLQEIDDDEDRPRRHKEDRDRQNREDWGHRDRYEDPDRRHRDRDDKRERRHKDRDEDTDRRRRHRDEDDGDDDRERRRMDRRKERESKEDEERRRRHEEKKERRRQEEERDRKKDEQSTRHKDRKERDRDRDRDERRDREREERRLEREQRQKEKEREERKHKSKQEEEKQEEEEDEYNYEEDFEEYEEDFEDDDDDDGGGNAEGHDSEVSAVLKALDAENDRLIQESARSPVGTYNYGKQRKDDESDDDSDDKYDKTYQPRMERPRTAINFVSAKQRAVNRKTASKTMQRGSDLSKMIELDFISFDILDMPPVNEYDLYIRAFGGTNTTQAYVQTNDDNVDRDIQTEEIDSRQKWTQHPPEDFAGCGRGDGEKDLEEEEESQTKQNKEQDTSRLNSFLENAGQVIAILLEESREEEGEKLGNRQSHIAVSEGYFELELLPILAGRHVTYSHFSPVQPNLLLTIYGPASDVTEENTVSKRGIICVWNTNEPNYPQKILACASQPRCCCFSPVKPSLVFAGMQDGSIAMWDLREATSLHQSTMINDNSYSLRYPTYDTAAVLSEENHHSPVTCISPIYSYINSSKSGSTASSQSTSASEESTSGLSFQLISTEETGVLHFWVVAELGSPDYSGSINDLGLAPGGSVKLIKSSTLTPDSSHKDSRLKVGGMKALDMRLSPADPNQYYIATDLGCVFHGVRFGKRAYPRAHSPVIESIVDVLSIDFTPFEKPCFLAGCSDGSFSLYHTKSANPLITWPNVTKGKPVICVRWSRSRPCVFYILDNLSTLYVFDLLEGDTGPKFTEQISKDRVVTFTMTNDYKANGLGTPGKNPQILFGLENGKTEIHTVAKSLRDPEDLEVDYLNSYLQRF